MLKASIFQSIAALAVTAKSRDEAAHTEFLTFYRELVETLPTSVTASFGAMPAPARLDGVAQNWLIELTATDFIWWKTRIEQSGARFVARPMSVQLDMLLRLSKQTEMQRLEPSERKAMLALLEAATFTRHDA